MPMFVGRKRLLKAGSLLGGLGVGAVDPAFSLEHTINARRAGGCHIGVEHHEGQPAIAFQRMLSLEVEDGLCFGVVQPMIARYPCVVLVDLTEPILPGIKLTGLQPQPGDEPPDG